MTAGFAHENRNFDHEVSRDVPVNTKTTSSRHRSVAKILIDDFVSAINANHVIDHAAENII